MKKDFDRGDHGIIKDVHLIYLTVILYFFPRTLKDGVGEVLRSLDNGGQANGASTIENSFSLQKMLLLLNKQGSGYR